VLLRDYRGGMKLLALVVAAVALGAPSKTVRLSIVHAVQGCHVWATDRQLGATANLSVKAGTRVEIRVSCPMSFTVTQVSGPPLAIGNPTFYTGTARTLVFPRRGVYVLRATNIQSSTDMGLQTLGTDNVLTLRVKVS
jgi:hypothetical protein